MTVRQQWISRKLGTCEVRRSVRLARREVTSVWTRSAEASRPSPIAALSAREALVCGLRVSAPNEYCESPHSAGLDFQIIS